MRRPLATALLLALGPLGCSAPRTPEAACARLISGVREGDGAQVFDALLKSTQWSLYSVAKSHAEMRDLIERTYPQAERQKALGRLLPGGASGRDLFRSLYAARYEADLRRRVGPGAPEVQRDGEGATCRLPGKDPFRLGHDGEGRWGLVELDREWDQAKLRAVHDLDTVRDNARLYQGARGP